jgi:gliding motility-associated-like protein
MRQIALKIFLLLSFILAVDKASAVTADFTADNIAGCAPLVVHFTNTSSGATSYSWDLGNGTTSGLTNVSGSYLDPGTYTVTLTAYNGSSTSVHTMTITVYAAPTVTFTATDTSICPGTGVTFTNTSTPGVPGPVSVIWNFGDGFTSTSATPTHSYTTPGYYNVTLSVTNAQGCVTTRTISSFVHVFNKPVPNFAATTTYFCDVPGHAVFNNSSTGVSPFTYWWSFGDGGFSTAANPTHDYASAGSYTVRLAVTDANGCTDTVTRPAYITVGNMTASYSSVTSVCVFNSITFYNTSSPHSSSNWTFGDGGTSTSDTASHIYSTPGTYNVRLIIYNGYCYDTVTHTITVLPQPTGTFTMTPAVACPAPATINFNATLPAGVTASWFFGDGGTGSGSSTTHTYTANGVYNVAMVITNTNGCKDTVTQQYVLNDMNFLIYPVSPACGCGCVPLLVNFGSSLQTTYPAAATYPSPATNYTWNFGDGSPTVSGASVTAPNHTFTAVGIFTVICTVTTANGCTRQDTTIVATGNPPVVTFTASPTHVCFHKPVNFVATVVTGPVDQYAWDWGDGASQIDSFPTTSHVFINPGTFHVTLVGMYHGCAGPPYTWTDSIIVDSPKAMIASAYHCDPYTRVTFDDVSLGNDAPLWFFGDGFTSTSDTPNHTYATPGIYTVRLTTYNINSGCRDTAFLSVNTIPPVPHIFASDTAVCSGDTVHFTRTITGSVAMQNFWDVNGVPLDIDTNAAFNYWFPTPGVFTIRYRMRDEHGCFDTAQKVNWIIAAHPVANFTAAPVIGCAPLIVTFTDASTDVAGATITNYKWNFGDASPTSIAVVTTPVTSHIYTAAGTYDVKEIVTDNIGCKDSSTRPAMITVWRPHASFLANTTYPCIGNTVHFTNLSTGIVGSYWMFGDGGTSTGASPDHVYTTAGSYTVKLVVTDVNGCTDTASYPGYINVTQPDANFHMDDSVSICPPLSVHFINTTTGGTSYNWNFGDGGSSISISPSDLYIASGIYTVTLVATNTYGCKDTTYGVVTIYGNAGGFTYTPLTGCAPLAVHFTAAVTNVPNVIWDFADGITSTPSSSDTATHVYSIPGSYVPKLILSDNSGCQSSSLGLDTIKVDKVTPGFKTDPYPVCVNSDVAFIDTSSSFFSTITSWHWGFGPGDTVYTTGTTRFFGTVGTFPVTLIVTDGWGCSGGVTTNVVVNPPPTIVASPDTTVCVGDPATLSAIGGVSYVWTPTPVTCPNCQTTQASPTIQTTYTVTGTDANGCVNTDTVTVSLRTKTISNGWGDTEVCQKVPVQLYDTGATTYTWVPAAGLNNATIYNPIATPSVTTTYMIIAQLGSCIPDTNYVTVIVHPLPTVNAGADQTLIAGSHAQIVATGTNIYTYMWEPGASLSCDTCYNPIANNYSTTTYTVTVSSDFGCKATDDVTIFLFCDESQIFIPNTFTPNGDGQNDVFYPRGSGVSKINAFRIYNRWGELLFERTNIKINDISKAWDGTFNGGTSRPDVYVYLVDAICDTGEPIFIKGDVTIVK